MPPTSPDAGESPPPVVVAVYNWTGLYIGIQGGYAWGDTEHELSGIAASTGDFRIKGGLVGGTVGYNYQVNSIVFGIEADYSWSGIKGNAGPLVVGTYGCGLGPQGCVTEVERFGTVRGRLGVAANQFLIFASGGWAYGHVNAFIDGARYRRRLQRFGKPQRLGCRRRRGIRLHAELVGEA